MAKDPAFLFYPGDFNTGTQFFSDEQVGKYMRLLMAQHQHGHLPENHMLMICKSYDKDVFNKFIKDKDGLWYNERLEIEIIKRKNYSKSRSENRNSAPKEKNISSTYDPHMENKNRNEDIINNKKESISKLELFDTLFNDERFVTDLSNTHKGKSLNQAFEECWMHHTNGKSPPSDVGEWKQKLNTWLANTKQNGNSKNGKQTTSDLAAALQNRIMQDVIKQQSGGSG